MDPVLHPLRIGNLDEQQPVGTIGGKDHALLMTGLMGSSESSAKPSTAPQKTDMAYASMLSKVVCEIKAAMATPCLTLNTRSTIFGCAPVLEPPAESGPVKTIKRWTMTVVDDDEAERAGSVLAEGFHQGAARTGSGDRDDAAGRGRSPAVGSPSAPR